MDRSLPKMYTNTFSCKKNGVEDVSAASLALHAQNFASTTEKNFVPEFTNRLSLTLHKVWFSLSQIFAYMDRIQERIWQNMYQRKPIFYSVRRISLISPETYTLLNKNNRHYTVNT